MPGLKCQDCPRPFTVGSLRQRGSYSTKSRQSDSVDSKMHPTSAMRPAPIASSARAALLTLLAALLLVPAFAHPTA